ncbi:MAG: triose-phosphate isomerase [Promethearchaeota archaeon]
MKFIIGGNWKMQMSPNKSINIAKKMVSALENISNVEIFIAPSFTSLRDLSDIFKGSNIKLAAQNMCEFDEGAYTGEIAGKWLTELGCIYVILGHSERRRIFKESNERINKKVLKALEIGLKPVLCIGETAEERNIGKKFKVNSEQLEISLKDVPLEKLSQIVIAYEPVWAINNRALNPTGEIRSATPDEAKEMHEFIRKWLVEKYGDIGKSIPIQYGGSVKPENCEELFKIADINGGLVGTASLSAEKFQKIAQTASNLS